MPAHKIFFGLVFSGFCVLLTSCNNTPAPQPQKIVNPQTDSIATDTLTPYEHFLSNFKKGNLEALQNPSQISDGQVLDKNIIRKYFSHALFRAAFGTKDIPNLEDNFETSSYQYGNMIIDTGAFKAFVIEKLDEEGKYYFLITMDENETFLCGMCVAFSEGDKSGKTERTVAINEDFSLQIRQYDLIGGRIKNEISRFYQINDKGKIIKFKAGFSFNFAPHNRGVA